MLLCDAFPVVCPISLDLVLLDESITTEGNSGPAVCEE